MRFTRRVRRQSQTCLPFFVLFVPFVVKPIFPRSLHPGKYAACVRQQTDDGGLSPYA
jgi:hypothetical protein